MEILYSAIVGELASRSMSFLFEKYSRHAGPSKEESLQRMLMRVCTIVEEAEGRLITNQGMLQQLNVLRDGMYRGYFVLDTFRYKAYEEKKAKDSQLHVSASFALSKFNPAKRICFSASSSFQRTNELEQVLDSLENMIADMNEFLAILENYPPMYRQPYSMHLLLEKCIFGRQMEMQQIFDFLLHKDPPAVNNLGVLPIVGPGSVGKSTIVEYVCNHERIRNHFSHIVFLNEHALKDQKAITLRDGGIIKHRNQALDEERLLVVIELTEDVDVGAWRRLCSAFKTFNTKIIITSRSYKITNIGTTQTLTLNFLPQEAFWYFFKVLTFGSTNPEEQPKLASIAMEISKEQNGTFLSANIVAGLLRANVNAQFWSRTLVCIRDFKQKYHNVFSEHPTDLWMKNGPVSTRALSGNTQYIVFHRHYETGFAQINEAPKITLQEVLFGHVKHHGKFEVLQWKSRLPPHNNYMHSCEIMEQKHNAIKKKRHQKRMI